MNLFAEFGINEEDLKNEKKDKKQNKKVDKPAKKAAKGPSYELPIAFYYGHIHYVFTDEKETKWTEDTLKSRIRSTFKELSGIFFKLSVIDVKEKESDAKTYIRPEIFYKALPEEKKLEFPLQIVVGETKMEFEADVTYKEIYSRWTQLYPEYTGCKFQYDEKQKWLIPFMEPNIVSGKFYVCPITVGYLETKEIYLEDDFKNTQITDEDIRNLYIIKYPEYKECSFYFNEELNLLFPLLPSSTQKDTVKNIALPVELRAGGFNLILKQDDMGGKSSVTLEEIRQELEKLYPEYSKERTEMLYDKQHFVVPVLKSSKKGYIYCSQDPEWNHEIVEDKDKRKWRVETTPFGIFKANLSQVESIQFELTAPKIPKELLEEVLIIFKKNPVFEYAIQIFYDRKKMSYEIFEPEQETSRSMVMFKRDIEMEKKKVLVMDIHSHGSYSAFFSAIDDHDEKGIRLYMVVGNLNQEDQTFALRAGLAGEFRMLLQQDIFN